MHICQCAMLHECSLLYVLTNQIYTIQVLVESNKICLLRILTLGIHLLAYTNQDYAKNRIKKLKASLWFIIQYIRNLLSEHSSNQKMITKALYDRYQNIECNKTVHLYLLLYFTLYTLRSMIYRSIPNLPTVNISILFAT